MSTTRCIAMILAGGRGERLGSLTKYYSKPAVHFGGGNRIIDFTLRNCRRSGIETVGILSQYFSAELHTYINAVNSENSESGNFYMLPSKSNEDLYTGTADAVNKNISFIDDFNPENVLVLAGDHIYDMNYDKMVDYHNEKDADVTIAVTPVPTREASRYGILNSDHNGRVHCFEEKPLCPKGNIASMGIYVFKWSALKKRLLDDRESRKSQHDFGKDILPRMLYDCDPVYAYMFDGYWKDVGTLDGFWEANMHQIDNSPRVNPNCGNWDIQGLPSGELLYNLADNAVVTQSIISGGCSIFGRVEHSVLGDGVTVEQGAEIVNSVIMPHVYIGSDVRINNAIIGTNAAVMDGTEIGTHDGTAFFNDSKICSRGISLVSPWLSVDKGLRVRGNSHITHKRLEEWNAGGKEVGTAEEPTHRRIEYRFHAQRRQNAARAYH